LQIEQLNHAYAVKHSSQFEVQLPLYVASISHPHYFESPRAYHSLSHAYELQSLTEQIGYIDETTEFNDLSVFDGQNRPVTLDDIGHTVNVTKHIPPSPTQHDINISTEKEARAAIRKIEEALQNVSLHRADLGAMINRLQFNIENLNSQSTALTDAASRIEDADMAQEMSDFLKYKLLTEVALSIVSQANQIPQMVSKLLQS